MRSLAERVGYTSGEWEMGEYSYHIGAIVNFPGDALGPYDIGRSIDEEDANRRIISCAPELLEALVEFYKAHDDDFNESECHFRCSKHGYDCENCIHVKLHDYRHLIEKATGMSWAELIKE